MAAAQEKPTVEHLHEWRKQVKYLRHQLELLRPMTAIVLGPFAERAEKLGDILGDDHDLAMLRREVIGDPEQFGWSVPKDFGERLHAYWKAWS